MGAVPKSNLLSIGDTLDLLKVDFSDLTISKLRFLENEGLVEPRRTASGYRKYTQHDIARLRFILTAQRDHYLPLRVIREQLEAMDRGLEVDGKGGSSVPANLKAVDTLPAAESDLDTFKSCQNFGLIPVSDFFNADQVAVLTTVHKLGKFGIEPRHLRQFKLAADTELGLIEQAISPISRKKDQDAVLEAADAARELAALTVGLHTALVRSGLGRTVQ